MQHYLAQQQQLLPSRCHLNQLSGSTDLTSCVTELKSHRLAIDRHNSFGEKVGRGENSGEFNFTCFPLKKKIQNEDLPSLSSYSFFFNYITFNNLAELEGSPSLTLGHTQALQGFPIHFTARDELGSDGTSPPQAARRASPAVQDILLQPRFSFIPSYTFSTPGTRKAPAEPQGNHWTSPFVRARQGECLTCPLGVSDVPESAKLYTGELPVKARLWPHGRA